MVWVVWVVSCAVAVLGVFCVFVGAWCFLYICGCLVFFCVDGLSTCVYAFLVGLV